MENANDKDSTFEHNRRMAEIHKKYEKKKKIRPLKLFRQFLKAFGL